MKKAAPVAIKMCPHARPHPLASKPDGQSRPSLPDSPFGIAVTEP
jgi:hypothetical protein